jgi:hypothetical protein
MAKNNMMMKTRNPVRPPIAAHWRFSANRRATAKQTVQQRLAAKTVNMQSTHSRAVTIISFK